MTPTTWLAIEILLGATFFGVGLPRLHRRLRLPNPAGRLPKTDEIPCWGSAAIVVGVLTMVFTEFLVMAVYLHEPPFYVHEFLLTTIAIFGCGFAVPSVVLRSFGRTVRATDPWFGPIDHLRQAAGVRRVSIRIVRSRKTRPALNLLGELELPSFLLRFASPEDVAILCAPALVQRTPGWRSSRKDLVARADRLVAQVFADPDVLYNAFVRQGASSVEARARVAALQQGRLP